MAVHRGKGERGGGRWKGEGEERDMVKRERERENASRQRREKGEGRERYNDDPDSRVEHVKPPVPQQLIKARIIRRWMTGYS